MIDQNAGELFTEQQAAKILHMSQRRLYSLRKQGKIAYIQDGHRVKYRRTQLDNYLETNTIPVQEVH
jgi:excisionase family DNA binding protein